MDEKLRQAIANLEWKQRQYQLVPSRYEDMAHKELIAAKEEVNSIIKAAKEKKKEATDI